MRLGSIVLEAGFSALATVIARVAVAKGAKPFA